jgi:heat shock protein HtpX
VLAHEFAHYYGGDTSLGPWVYKTKASMVRIFENIGSVGELARIAILGLMYTIVATLLKWFFMAFLRGINVVSRKQEYRADELACLIAGRRNLISGLQALHRAATAWTAYWNNEVAPALDDGSLVAVGEGFCRFVSVPEISAAISKNLETRLREEKTRPYDTHPPPCAIAWQPPRSSRIQPWRRIPNPAALCWRICPLPKCNLSRICFRTFLQER